MNEPYSRLECFSMHFFVLNGQFLIKFDSNLKAKKFNKKGYRHFIKKKIKKQSMKWAALFRITGKKKYVHEFMNNFKFLNQLMRLKLIENTI